MKAVMVICDGMGDRPIGSLGYKTPLQTAKKPNFDRVAKDGMCGLMYTIGPGITPGSDTAHLALLGYDPVPIYTGRGPFEAMGIGMEVRPGDVAFRCNFATVDGNKVIDRRAGRIRDGTQELAAAVSGMEIEGVKIIVREGVEHRGVLILRGEGLDPHVGDIDPHKEQVPMLVSKALKPSAEKTARILNTFTTESMKILSESDLNKGRERPANAILARGPGQAPHIPQFQEKHGMKGAVVVGIPLVRGLCRFAGLEVRDVQGATGSIDTNFEGKARAVAAALKTNDFVLLHFKAPDVYSHDRKPAGKVKGVQDIDRAIGIMLEEIGDEAVIALTADHTTPCEVGDHTADPVPLAIWGKGLRADAVKKYDEISCASGMHNGVRGVDLIPLLKGYANRSAKYGA